MRKGDLGLRKCLRSGGDKSFGILMKWPSYSGLGKE